MALISKVRRDIISHESELIAQADVFLILYVVCFTIFNANLGTNVYTNVVGLVFMFLAFLYCFIDSSVLINRYSVLTFLFTAYCLISVIWSPTKDYSLTNCRSLSRFLVMAIFMYNYLASRRKKDLILSAFVVAGICASIYTILHYGPIKYLNGVLSGRRMGSEIYLINYVGFILVISSLTSFWFTFFRKKWWDVFPAVLCFVVAIGTGSRAAILSFAAGIVFLLFFLLRGKWRFLYPLFIIAGVLLGIQLLKLPFFSVIRSRLESTMNFFTNDGLSDGSTIIRINMIKWAFEQFLKTPVFGLGFYSGSAVMAQHGSELALYHNTYAELLAGVGLIGTCLYLCMFIYPFVRLIKPALKGDSSAIIGIVLILVFCFVIFNSGSEICEKPTPIVICYLFLAVYDLDKPEISR